MHHHLSGDRHLLGPDREPDHPALARA
jgi:hypothetical protein